VCQSITQESCCHYSNNHVQLFIVLSCFLAKGFAHRSTLCSSNFAVAVVVGEDNAIECAIPMRTVVCSGLWLSATLVAAPAMRAMV
jgi:hypothetical protein